MKEKPLFKKSYSLVFFDEASEKGECTLDAYNTAKEARAAAVEYLEDADGFPRVEIIESVPIYGYERSNTVNGFNFKGAKK